MAGEEYLKLTFKEEPPIELVAAALTKYPSKIMPFVKRGLKAMAMQANSILIKHTKRNLHKRTGALARGWASPKVAGTNLASLTVTFINREKYARIQETGEPTIKPVNAKFLAIPIPGSAAMTAAGVARYASPSDFPGPTFIARSKAGNLLIFAGETKKVTSRETKSKSGLTKIVGKTTTTDMEPIYILKTSVKIPPRLGAEIVLRSRMSQMGTGIQAGFLEGWKNLFESAGGGGGSNPE